MNDHADQAASATVSRAYCLPLIILHWLTAICVFILIPVGIALDKVPEGPLQDRLFNGHRSFGILVLVLAVLRVMMRRMHGTPAPASVLSDFERKASTAVHHLLYVLLFLTPIIGWAMVSAYGAEVSIFGLFILPPILPQNENVYKALSNLHAILGITMAITVLAHAGAGLMHALIKRDGVMQRMLPWTKA